MKAPIVLHFDFSSPRGYIAAQTIEALAARHDRSVDWWPMLLGVAFKVAGTAPLTMVPLNGDYSKRDVDAAIAQGRSVCPTPSSTASLSVVSTVSTRSRAGSYAAASEPEGPGTSRNL